MFDWICIRIYYYDYYLICIGGVESKWKVRGGGGVRFIRVFDSKYKKIRKRKRLWYGYS